MSADTVVCHDIDGQEHEVSIDQLRWRPSVYGIIIQDGRILLSRQHNAYTIPGGGVELGEMPEEAILREVKEETGIEICNPRLELCASTFFKLSGSAKGAHAQTILLYYHCDVAGGKLSADFMTPEERTIGGELPEWVPLEKLGQLKLVGTTHWLPVVQDMIGQS